MTTELERLDAKVECYRVTLKSNGAAFAIGTVSRDFVKEGSRYPRRWVAKDVDGRRICSVITRRDAASTLRATYVEAVRRRTGCVPGCACAEG